MKKTKTKEKKKTFDAVLYMRKERNRITKEIHEMSNQEIIAYFKSLDPNKIVRPGA
jgi:hypothetical protein